MNAIAAGEPRLHHDRGVRPHVRGITVLYDPNCPVCRASKRWMMMHRPIIDVRFVAVDSPLAAQRFPHLDLAESRREITVVTDTGYVYRGKAAFILCLWSLRRTRGLALQMAAGRKATVLTAMVGATGWFREVMLHGGCDDACQTRLSR